MATITRMKEFRFILTLQDKLITCEFDYFPNNRVKYASGLVYVVVSDRKTAKDILHKIILDTDGRNPYKVFYQCAKEFLKLKKKLEKVKTYNELLNLL
jgi:hypothetical protein